jgi:dTDP-4-dehydrorhamnose 3,5-epimerase
MSEFAEVSYKATELYAPAFEKTVLWSDPAIGIEWPLDGEPTLSEKDKVGSLLVDAETYPSSGGLSGL